MKNLMNGAYFDDKTEEFINFNFYTNLTAANKLKFVNSVLDTLIDDIHYDFVLKDMVFDFMIVKMFTDINTRQIEFNANEDDNFNVIDNIEQFLNETNIVDVVKTNMEDGLLDELDKAVNLGIAYRTGIHPNPINEALAGLIGTFEKKINNIDLNSVMDMAKLFAGVREDFTPENVVNAYLSSDVHKKNLEEITDAKAQKTEAAKNVTKVVDIKAKKKSTAKDNKKQED